MVFHAAHLAAQPNSSLKAPSMAFSARETQRMWRPFRVLEAVSCGLGLRAEYGCGWWSFPSQKSVG